MLYAANIDNDAEKVVSLIKDIRKIGIKSTHNVHFQNPKEFVNIINEFTNNNGLNGRKASK